MKKIAVFASSLVNKGGAERIILYLWKHYNADIYVGQYSPETTFEEFKKANVIACITGTPRPRVDSLKMIHWFGSLKLQDDTKCKYDAIINMGGIAALHGIVHNHPQMLYACMPISWLYHRYDEELARHSLLTKPLWHVLFSGLRMYDRYLTRKFDKVSVISKTTQNNFFNYLNVGSSIIYPPTDIDSYTCGKQDDYYLWVGRLTEKKRPQTVLEAFRLMPDKKLKIVGGGEMLDELRNNAPKNVEVVGPVTEQELRTLYSNCIAAVYVSTREDFGYIPIEANASGKPCIATNEAGFKETIIHQKTGFLVDNPTPESVKDAVTWLTPGRAHVMKKDCLAQAQKYSLKKFIKDIDTELDLLMNKDYPPYEWEEKQIKVRCEDCGKKMFVDDSQTVKPRSICPDCWQHERKQ